MSEERRITVEDRTYGLRSWSTTDGDVWAFRLMALAVSNASDDQDGAAARLMTAITEKDFVAFRDACLKYTDIVEIHEETGEELVRPLAKNREALRGKYFDLFSIMKGHIGHEFSPFLNSLGRLLVADAGTKRAAS